MDQMRTDDDMPNRASNMEQAEGSREQMRNRGESSRERSGGDLGTSSDRAMFDERMSNTRSSSMERGSANSGGITNRELDREQCEQDQLPPRGESQSER